MAKLRTFSNGIFTLSETPQDNLFYYTRNDGRTPSEVEAIIAFTVLYRDIMVGSEKTFVPRCQYDAERNCMRITVKDAKTQLMPESLKRSKDSKPEPSFPVVCGVITA